MTAPRARLVSSLGAVLLAVACTNSYEIQIETPIRPKLDVGAFQRVLVAGFLAGGTDDVDGNLETTRLLRSQLRTKSELRVIDSDVLPLMDVAAEARTNDSGQAPAPAPIKEQKDLEPFEHVFANVEYWKKIGEEYQQPLIVTGTVLFTPQSKSGMVSQTRETYDNLGRRVVMPMRVFMERKGYILRPKFIFIDGRTGTRIYSESFREERLYPSQQNVPALSSYFELMDDVIPRFLNVLSTQKVRGTRVLLK
jgi:hypothetical protein